ncbi:TNT domain-containing protein [Streptomyces sp. NPDC005046]
MYGDWRFGPAHLPKTGVLGGILSGYQRFGQLTPVEFLNKWWNPTADFGRGDWRYPPDQGFEHNNTGQVIAGPVTLHPGDLVDRFGDEFGRYLAPAGAKFAQRALPPSNLNTSDPGYPYNYHLHRVVKDTVLCAGPQAAAFEQPGQGVQYVTSPTFWPRAGVVDGSVNALVAGGNLQRAN